MRLLYVVTEDWYFLLHRLPMARAARDAGFEVHVATRVNDGRAAIEAEGITVHPVPFVRGRVDPVAMLRTISTLRRLRRELKPEVTHHVSLQSDMLGALAAVGLPGARLYAFTGLGHLFVSQNFGAKTLRAAMSLVMRSSYNGPNIAVLVENPDDTDTLAALGVDRSRIVVILGSGVDVERLRPAPEPPGSPKAAFVGRLIEVKGIRTLIEAQRLLRRRGSTVELLVAGTPDPGNPGSIPAGEIESWKREPGITMLGRVDDIPGLWARAAIAVLPSQGGEGVPMSLLEAAACGRPMVATDVPGCREIVRPGETGLLVPPNDAPALADAIEALAGSAEVRAHHGAAARRLAVETFAAESVGRQTVDLYRRLAKLNKTA